MAVYTARLTPSMRSDSRTAQTYTVNVYVEFGFIVFKIYCM